MVTQHMLREVLSYLLKLIWVGTILQAAEHQFEFVGLSGHTILQQLPIGTSVRDAQNIIRIHHKKDILVLTGIEFLPPETVLNPDALYHYICIDLEPLRQLLRNAFIPAEKQILEDQPLRSDPVQKHIEREIQRIKAMIEGISRPYQRFAHQCSWTLAPGLNMIKHALSRKSRGFRFEFDLGPEAQPLLTLYFYDTDAIQITNIFRNLGLKATRACP